MKKEKKEKRDKYQESCNFGLKKFNLKKDKKEYTVEEASSRNRPTKGKPPKDGVTPPPPPPSSGGVIFLDFTGYLVTGTSWNANGDINASPANLSSQQVDEILLSVQEDYAAFNVLVTTDESVYDKAEISRRTRCILTETWEWFGQAGGVAFLNSFFWGDNTPCFIFTSLLGYNTKYIKEATSHEVGHTLGLRHQSYYNEQCLKVAEYNQGCCGEAPIMGVSYYQENGKWWVGPSSSGCYSIQDDAAILAGVLGLK